MQVRKPKKSAVYVSLTERGGARKALGMTIYDATPEQVREWIKSNLPRGQQKVKT
jgi:hypothetical protein